MPRCTTIMRCNPWQIEHCYYAMVARLGCGPAALGTPSLNTMNSKYHECSSTKHKSKHEIQTPASSSTSLALCCSI